MNIYETLGLPEVINASGRMTKLGVSCISDPVAQAITQAGQQYVDIDRLYKAAGKRLAEWIHCDDACITASASSGIVLSIASLLCRDDLYKIQHLEETKQTSERREVLLLKGQNVDFGAPVDLMIETGGGIVKEVGYANRSQESDVIGAISERTLAIFFVKSHHCVQKNMLSAEAMIRLANRLNIPIVIDASAEEDLTKYVHMGADYVCYSGAKAICGPTAGFVACKRSFDAECIRMQYAGIGRAMKVGKETVMGLLKAVELYQNANGSHMNVTLEELSLFADKISRIPGLNAVIAADEAGRNIHRCKIRVHADEYGRSAKELMEALQAHSPQIYIRNHEVNLGILTIDPRPLRSAQELAIIEDALQDLKRGSTDR